MNNMINHSSFTEMFLQSSEDYEPYGCVDEHTYTEETVSSSKMIEKEVSELVF